MGQGDVLAGRYRLLERIGTGSMGDVWRARDLELDRDVAVKMQLPFLLEDPRFVERFRSEARTLARLKHPGIVTVHDFGESTNPRALYLVMELLEGQPLCDVLAASDVLTVPRTLSLVRQTLDALEVAHRHGIVHRDVKPANLILDADDRVTVTDFGVARSAGAKRLTASGTLMGTALYSAPEQARSGEVTAAADLYAVGVIAYECLCGLPPFDADDSLAVLVKHATEPVPDLPEDLPGAVRELILRALAKDPVDRFASATEMAEAVRSARAELGPDDDTFPWRAPAGTASANAGGPVPLSSVGASTTASPAPGDGVPAKPPTPHAGTEGPGTPLSGRNQGRRRLIAAGAALAAVVLGLGVTAVLRMTDNHTSTSLAGKGRPRPSTSDTAQGEASGTPQATPGPGSSKSSGPLNGASGEASSPEPIGSPPPSTGLAPTARSSPSATKTTPAEAAPRQPGAGVATGGTGSYHVSGAVGCSSGAAVVGVWVHGDVTEGWASLSLRDGGPRKNYSFDFPTKQSYSLHVGCGEDDNRQWLHGPHSTTVSGTSNSFDCYDEPGDARYDSCPLRPRA
ncbi:protein kinase [Streptomyces sp. NPDC088925]|uniref:serine/threonine-protein kinase n=1 Tax=Streptomyces sp. NPDC088925 TaxID=3365914 RepID=UPI0037F1F524